MLTDDERDKAWREYCRQECRFWFVMGVYCGALGVLLTVVVCELTRRGL